MAKKSRETALAEITLRKYEAPTTSNKRELVKKLCLSLGLLQPGDSRDVVVDVLMVLLQAEEPLNAKQVEHAVIDHREKHKLQALGVAPSNIRRQLLRLRELFLVEKIKNEYRIKEKEALSKLFSEHVEAYYLSSIIKRVKDYLKAVDKSFNK